MKYIKIRDVKSPSRGTEKSAGIDFFVPNDQETIVLKSNESTLFPTGIKMNII
jgi:dUTPase